MLEGRRGFLGLLAAALGGPGLAGRTPAAAPGPERDTYGHPVADAYRLGPDGAFRMVPRSSLRPGDRFLMLGLDGDRLWKAEAFTVGGRGWSRATDGKEYVHFTDSSDLLRAVRLRKDLPC